MRFLKTIKNKTRWDRIENEENREGLVKDSLGRGTEIDGLVMWEERILCNALKIWTSYYFEAHWKLSTSKGKNVNSLMEDIRHTFPPVFINV